MLPELSKEMLTEYIKLICSCGYSNKYILLYHDYEKWREQSVGHTVTDPKKGQFEINSKAHNGAWQ